MAEKFYLLSSILFFLCFVHKPGVFSAKFAKNGEIRFGNFHQLSDGQILEINGSVIKNMTVKSKNQCLLECVEEERCFSMNVYSGQAKEFQCELLDWSGTGFHNYLKPKLNSQFILMSTACFPNPCQNGGDCMSLAGGHQYNCSCVIPFTGDNCEKDNGCVLFDFENGLPGWNLTGTAFNNQPTYGDNSKARAREPTNPKGHWYIGGYENRSSPSHPAGAIQGDAPTGTLTSPKFLIRGRSLKFLIGGGADVNTERVELLISGAVVARAASPTNIETLTSHTFDVTSYRGQVAQLRFVDNSTIGWGHINADHFEDSICTE